MLEMYRKTRKRAIQTYGEEARKKRNEIWIAFSNYCLLARPLLKNESSNLEDLVEGEICFRVDVIIIRLAWWHDITDINPSSDKLRKEDV